MKQSLKVTALFSNTLEFHCVVEVDLLEALLEHLPWVGLHYPYTCTCCHACRLTHYEYIHIHIYLIIRSE